MLLFRACNVIERWIRGNRTKRWIETGKFERLSPRQKRALNYLNRFRRWLGGFYVSNYEVRHTFKTTDYVEAKKGK